MGGLAVPSKARATARTFKLGEVGAKIFVNYGKILDKILKTVYSRKQEVFYVNFKEPTEKIGSIFN
jgi:hypothetical protein